ncbi:MAG TPA: hypothetical protein K8V84_07190 [Nocardiopsis listeri]|uniref:hypothetical protein n=1 Tax=Nocardiopsis listeri TaxID=53440 RepID=UPI001DC1481D|nr:hypothetical protein [Nocardiopsis listeri]HJE58286.1 hypothetical protein [Nocardiopsis listeri]
METRGEDGIESALAVVTFYQNNVAQADTKIGFLCVAQVGFAMALVNGKPPATPDFLPTLIPLLACSFAFLASGYHLFRALRPRMRFWDEGRMIGGFLTPRPKNPLTSDEVWRMAEVLSGIVSAKNWHIQRCIPWLAFLLSLIVANGLSGIILG